MSTEAQISANEQNAQNSTGPRTAEGKSRSSRNSTSFGLFSAGDFVRPEEQHVYQQFCTAFHKDLVPEGAMEQTIAAEIIHAAWRLRRCAAIESSTSPVTTPETDFIEDPITAPVQTAVDRARNQAHRTMQRATTELRRLQTERHFRLEIFPGNADTRHLGLASYTDMEPVLTQDVQRRLLQHKLDEEEIVSEIIEANAAKAAKTAAPAQDNSPQNTNRTQCVRSRVPRNARCSCGSGLKYKRCCGKSAPVVLKKAA